MGGEPFSLFRFPEVTHSSLCNKLRREVNTWLEQSNAHIRVSFFDFAERIPLLEQGNFPHEYCMFCSCGRTVARL
jgi:hypothetical protein